MIKIPKKAPLIYVWLGDIVPGWAFESFSITRKYNPYREIFFLHNNYLNDKFEKYFRDLNIQKVYIEIKQKDSIIFKSSNFIESNFWKYTSFRFEIIRYFLKNKKIKKFYQAEIDNLLFNFDELDSKFNKKGKGLFVPRDSLNRALASFFYCNDNNLLDQLIQMYLPPFNAENDMLALGMLAKVSKKVFSLPTESYYQNSKFWKILPPYFTNGIFDAAAIGQYCLGIDPKINKFKPTCNLFVNENSKADFNNIKITSDGEQLFVKAASSKKSYKLFNLHVHSKDIKKAISLINKKKIYKRLQKKRKSIVSGRYKIIYFLPRYIKHIFRYLIKNLIEKWND